jgi:hypothetical protein
MTDRLDLVAVRVADIGAVIVGVIMGPKARRSLVTAAIGQGGGADGARSGARKAVWLPLPTLAGCLLWGGNIQN